MSEKCFNFFSCILGVKWAEKEHVYFIIFFTKNYSRKQCEKYMKNVNPSFKIFTKFSPHFFIAFFTKFSALFPLNIVVKNVLHFPPQFPGGNRGEF